ncbi:hypothetical protein SeLEV6574_g07639 [Synchytrium endobioticum]|uniref:Reelin domain-containing protein n=1 Tax=Synchytrium endobioticum TaxID=286115 RepID=A0A507CH84_9FUNG|nr:hypothetical protein SeLEV6574_g07639 [Synchytrium endobioticum]
MTHNFLFKTTSLLILLWSQALQVYARPAGSPFCDVAASARMERFHGKSNGPGKYTLTGGSPSYAAGSKFTVTLQGDNIVGMLLGVQDSTNKYFPMDVPTTGNFQLCSGTAPGTNQAITHKAANSGLTTLPLTMTVPAGTTGPLTVTALVVGNSAAGQGWNVVSVTIPAGAGTGAGAATGATGNNGTVAPRPTQVVTTLFPSPNVTPPPPPPPGTQTIPAAKLEAKSTKTDSVFHGLPDPSLSTAAANLDNKKIADANIQPSLNPQNKVALPAATLPPPPPPGTQTFPAAKLEAKSTTTDSVFHGLPDPSLSTGTANVDNNKIAGANIQPSMNPQNKVALPIATLPPPPPPGTQTIPAAKLEAKSTTTDSVFHGLPDPSLSTAAANVDNNKIAGKSSTLAPKPPAPPSTNGGPAAIKPQKQSNPTTSAPKPPAPQSTNGGPAAIKPQKQSKPTTSAPKPPAPQSTNGGAAAIKPQTLNGVDVPQNVAGLSLTATMGPKPPAPTPKLGSTKKQNTTTKLGTTGAPASKPTQVNTNNTPHPLSPKETLPTPSPKPSFVPKADNKKLPDAKKKVTAEEKKAKDDAKKKLAAGEKKAKSTHKASPRPQNKTPRATNTKPSKARATGK